MMLEENHLPGPRWFRVIGRKGTGSDSVEITQVVSHDQQVFERIAGLGDVDPRQSLLSP